jgi:hypothetical protein
VDVGPNPAEPQGLDPKRLRFARFLLDTKRIGDELPAEPPTRAPDPAPAPAQLT